MAISALRSRPAAGCLLLLTVALAAPGGMAMEDPAAAWLEALRQRDSASLGRLAAGPAVPVDATLPDGTTALMVAARQGPPALMERLVALGADVRAENTRGGTALMYAAVAGDPATLAWLLDHGARIRERASNGWSALTIAAAKGHEAAVRLLLARGADPDKADIYGGTPLIRAVEGGYGAAARILLEEGGAAVDAVDEQGATALHHAAANGDSGIVGLLLRYGADPGRRTGRGLTPGDVARMGGRDEVAAVLARRVPPG